MSRWARLEREVRAAWGKPEREERMSGAESERDVRMSGAGMERKVCASGAEDGNSKETDAVLAEAFIERIRRMNRSMGIPEQLVMLRKEDVPELAARALKEGNPNYPGSRDLGRGADAVVPDGTGTKVTVQWASRENIAQNSSRILQFDSIHHVRKEIHAFLLQFHTDNI